MSRFIVASHCIFAILVSAGLSAAQAPAAAPPLLLFKAPPHAASRWRARLQPRGAPERDPPRDARSLRGVDAARVQELAQLEQLLGQARRQAGELSEDEALASLALAASVADGLADVPGAAAWQAEVQLRLGVTAAQAGLDALADAASTGRRRSIRGGICKVARLRPTWSRASNAQRDAAPSRRPRTSRCASGPMGRTSTSTMRPSALPRCV